MKKFIIYISFTVLVYVICFFLDGTQKVHAISDEKSEGRRTSYDYHLFHRNEYSYDVYKTEETLVHETLFIDWDMVIYFPYFLIFLTVLGILKNRRKNDNKPFPFLKRLKKNNVGSETKEEI